MIEHLLLFFALLAIIIALVMVSNHLKVAYPVLLVLGGLAISFVPNLPSIKIDPELIFIIFLPPLLYEAAWANSLKELFKWRLLAHHLSLRRSCGHDWAVCLVQGRNDLFCGWWLVAF